MQMNFIGYLDFILPLLAPGDEELPVLADLARIGIGPNKTRFPRRAAPGPAEVDAPMGQTPCVRMAALILDEKGCESINPAQR